MFLLSHNQCNQKIHVRMLNHISYIQFKLFLHHSIDLNDEYGFPSHIRNFQSVRIWMYEFVQMIFFFPVPKVFPKLLEKHFNEKNQLLLA